MTLDGQGTPDNSEGTIAQKLALWADILRDCSARGLQYSENMYDRENYKKIQDIALGLMALASTQPLAEIEPLRVPIFSRPAAIPVGDAAIIDDEGKVLLILRADNLLWAMPGGGLEVGETPAQGVVREALEESGVACEPVALVGVFDSRLCGSASRHHLYQLVFLCRPLPDVDRVDPPSHANEIKEIRWFAEDALPRNLDPGHARRIPEAFRVWHGDKQAFFDQIVS